MNRGVIIRVLRILSGIIFSCASIFLMHSCTNPRDKVVHGKLIPEKEFVSVMSDIYIANGLLSLPAVRYQFFGRDTISNYIDIIEGHGYTYETMYNTMNYYFNTKPKRLVKIYDLLIKEMNEEQAALQNDLERQADARTRLSPDYNVYYLPDPSRQGEPATIYPLTPPCSFVLVFYARVYPDDKSYKPHFAAYLVDADSLETGRKKWLPEIGYIKDGYRYQYTYTGRVESTRPAVLKIIFYNCENNIDEWDKHARIELDSFTSNSDPV